MPRTTKDKIIYWVFADRIPLTKLVIVSNILTWLAISLFGLSVLTSHTVFSVDGVVSMPWTVVTYPLLGSGGPLFILFACYWMWVAGGSLERSWGTSRFAAYFFSMTAVSALGLYVGSFAAKAAGVSASGLWLPIAGITVAFAMLNPEEQILFMLFLPMKLKYLALIDVALVLVAYGANNPILGVFALAGCAYSYSYVRRPRRYEARPRAVRADRSRRTSRKLNPFSWMKEQRERRRLKRFLERSSGSDDDGPD